MGKMNLSCWAPAGRMDGRGRSCFGCQEEVFLCSRSCCSRSTSSIPCCRSHLPLYLFRKHHPILTEFLRSIFPKCHRIQWECNLEGEVQFFWLLSVTQTIGSSRFGEVSFRPVDSDCLLFLATLCKATISFKFSLQESQNQVFILLKVFNVCFLF